MTAIIKTGTPSSVQHVIPPSIVLLEQLISWCLCVLWALHRNSDFYPDKNLPPVKRVQKTTFMAGDGRPATLWSLYLTNDPSFGSAANLKEWMAQDEISNVVAGTEFNT